MNKLLTKIVGSALGLTMAVGVGIAVTTNKEEAALVHAAAGDEITYTITQATVTGYPSSYSSEETVWSQTNDGGNIEMSFALAQHMKSDSYMQSKASVGYFRNTTIPTGYAIKSIQVVNGKSTQRTWNLYGGSDVLTTSNYSGAKTVVSSTTAKTAVEFGSGTTYDSTNYPYSYFYAKRGSNVQYSNSYVITLVELSKSTTKLTGITVSGSLTKNEYTTADSWDNSGLTVTANYDDSSKKTVTGSSTWSYSPATPKEGGPGTYNVRFTAEYQDSSAYIDIEVTVTKAIEYELVTDATKLTKGTKAIFVSSGVYKNNTYTSALSSISGDASTNYFNVATVSLSDGFNAGSIAISTDATIFTLGGSIGVWTLTDGGTNQVAFTGINNNNVKFNSTDKDTFTITSGTGNIVTVDSNTQSGRGLRYNVNSGSPRFSNYTNSGMAAIYMFADIAEASYGTTDHISVATLPQTEFAVGDTFNTTGIAINAWDNSDEETGNSKVVDSFSTSVSDSPSTPFTDNDIGSHVVTVTYTENGNNFTATYEIYVYASAKYELVTSEPADGWAGSYLITSTVSDSTSEIVGDGTYAMKSTLNNFDVIGNYAAVTPVTEGDTKSIIAGQHLQFSIAAITGGYSIQGKSGKYLGWNDSSKNGLTTSDSALVNTLTINGIDVTILCPAGEKGLTLSVVSGQFRYYSNATVQLYKLVQSSEASSYADLFLSSLSTGEGAVCKYDKDTGVVSTDLEELKFTWATLALYFDDLSNADKQIFTQGSADESGDNISKALALYDHISSAYGTRLQSDDCDNYNFMSRSITPLSGSKIILDSVFGNNNDITAVIVIVSLVSLTAFGVYFFFRKKKEQ